MSSAPAIVTPDMMPPPKRDEFNRVGLNLRAPMPRPRVKGTVVDFHSHLLAARHGEVWFKTCDHFGIDVCLSMNPLEEAMGLQQRFGHRLQFIAVPQWGENDPRRWHSRLEAYYNLGSRILKVHMSPGTMFTRNVKLSDAVIVNLIDDAVSRGMAMMTHIGDPQLWYDTKYTDVSQFGTRDAQYQLWEDQLHRHREIVWIGAHLGGNPENPTRLQRLLDTFPNLYLDCSATRWMQREVSVRRDEMREFFIRNADRILFGSDQVSGNAREFDFLASRLWVHRKLWETAYIGDSPIFDPDLPKEEQPQLRGLALPDSVLQKLYVDNAAKVLSRIGASFSV